MTEANKKSELLSKNIDSLIEEYCNIVEKGLKERWDKLDIQLYNSECYEVIGGLLARQSSLSIQLACSPSIWNGHIAPLILRCMTDAHITLAWILLNPDERVRKYIIYGLGQEKLYIEHLKAQPQDEQIQELIKVKELWLNSQRRDFLVEVNVGNWAGLNTRQMAIEAGCESLYNFAYTPFSGPAHNMWQHISMYDLKMCNNPLHKYHRVPTVEPSSSDLDYLYRSAKYVEKSYCIFDDKFKLKIDTSLPLQWFIERVNSFSEKNTV